MLMDEKEQEARCEVTKEEKMQMDKYFLAIELPMMLGLFVMILIVGYITILLARQELSLMGWVFGVIWIPIYVLELIAVHRLRPNYRKDVPDHENE